MEDAGSRQDIQWFPGHMAKTKRQIEKNLKLVDAVAEIVDARVPVSSRNPDLDRLVNGKPRVILLNKADLADPAQNSGWLSFYREKGIPAVAVDSKTGKGLEKFLPAVKSALGARLEEWKSKGMVGRKIRVMVVGIPNVGKSSMINRLAKGGKANVADRPGVTRSSQWFPVGNELELLDTPGVLWPKLGDARVGEHLAFTGAVKGEILDSELLARRLLEVLRVSAPGALRERYKTGETDLAALSGSELLELIARKRGMLVSGGLADTERAAVMVLDEFRGGKLGRITLERAGGK
jgi:ribosome biogenesis GTPase A